MAASRKHEIGVGVLLLMGLAVLAYMSIKVGALRNMGEEIRVNVALGDAAGLNEGAAVRIAGVQVGQILSMGVSHDLAELTATVRKDAQVRIDAKVRVRARSILGEKYLEFEPQSTDAPLVEEGTHFSVARDQTEIDELVNSLGPLVDAMDADALSLAMDRITQALDEDPDRIARMLRDLDTLLNQAATASAELPGLVADTRSTLKTVQEVADAARPVIRRSNTVLQRVEQASEDLPQIADQVATMLTDAQAMMKDSRTLIERMDRSTAPLETVLENLSEIDKWELRRLLREEGILIRLKKTEVEQTQ
jgi:phospholipid/cholesterol/gamma-HCH transport system substrate-binding protein